MPREALRLSHVGITLNNQSAKMEERLDVALAVVADYVFKEYGLTIVCDEKLVLTDIVGRLNSRFGGDIGHEFQTVYTHSETYLRPDGGFWYVEEWGTRPKRYVLVAEAKRQGTNDARALEGKPKQARGNAIERLGKNLRGVDSLFRGEGITPFAVFGEGCDFGEDSSIIDRVATMNGFLPLNTVFVKKIHSRGEEFAPVSMFFRAEAWTPQEMADVMIRICDEAIPYYLDTYDL
jgi:type II restriction enzyme